MSPPLQFFSNPDAAVLLQDAPAKKNTGDFDLAIAALRKAYGAIAEGSVSYPVGTFLRLPAYLQAAGRSSEAWQAYKDLLANGYPHQYATPTLIPMDHSAIYDKMRLFLQREGLPAAAVAYRVLAHCSWAVGLYRQGRGAELRDHIAASALEKLTLGPLRRAGRTEVQERLCAILATHLHDITALHLLDLFVETNGLLCLEPHQYN